MSLEKLEQQYLREELRLKGLMNGIAPIYLDFFLDEETDKNVVVAISRPFTQWLATLSCWAWDATAVISGNPAYIGQYKLQITGENSHYTGEDDDRADNDGG